MFKMLGAAVAAIFLSFAGSASAAVLFQESGTFGGEPEIWAFVWLLPYSGRMLEVEINYSTNSPAPVLEGVVEYRINYAHEGGGSQIGELWFEFDVEGNSAVLDQFTATGTPGKLTATILPPSSSCADWNGVGTCKYYEVSALTLRMLSQPGDTLTYDLTVRSLENSAVPEPATWAMLIAGLGMAGAALRVRPQSSRKSPLARDRAGPSPQGG